MPDATQMRSNSAGVETPSATTAKASRLTAAHTRLMMKPTLSLRATAVTNPCLGSSAPRTSKIRSSVCPSVTSSACGASGGCP
ncbi:Uncharacterised protein [Mycobacteroides abscessus subsp. abscessus]|nr:Uncharacterised protein [Mycobacteroides abscessus subsp. abscessus]